ncbi:MAG TPA: DeoR/GlpR family DNA-binding transcription regulator [Spirochaetia bacterium]|nr:DeoR/GlpR family DNA-binding transcription regulator [Spirochaetia bacterium]
MNDRQSRILGILASGDQTSVNDLSRELEVSSVTVRQDLNYLEKEGLLQRVHGGAVLRGPDDITSRLGVNYEKKIVIAREAASLVEDGETIFIESGSINALLAKELMNRSSLTVLTTNVFIARQLRKAKHVQVVLMGGVYQHESESVVGQLTKACIEQVNFGKSFVGVDGFSPEAGFTSRDMMRAEIAAEVISRSRGAYVLTDSSKFGRSELRRICETGSVACVITDKGVPEESRAFLVDNGVEVLVV